jgi:predicted DsbA family dithiol-disulfide isomerase
MPGGLGEAKPGGLSAGKKPVKIYYFTDPICSSCWGIEPQLRRLKREYGVHFELEYRMGGLLPDWSYNSGGISKPSDVAHHWDEVSLHYDMPIDGDVWLEDPLHSSYPPSIAFKAAQLQDDHKALLFLRAMREMVFLEKKNITRWEHLEAAAHQVGLDTHQLKRDYEGRAEALFQEDLTLARKMGVRGFPTLFFTDSLSQVLVYGFRPYQQFEEALKKLHPTASRLPMDTSPTLLFQEYGSLTTREYAVLSGKPRAACEAELQALADRGNLVKLVTKNGVLWKGMAKAGG